MRRRTHSLTAAALSASLASACASTAYTPSRSPLAKLVDHGAQAELHVGGAHARVAPFGRTHLELLHPKAQPIAERSQRHQRTAVFLHIPAAVASVTALALAFAAWKRDADGPYGRAAVGLGLSSAVIGAFATQQTLLARGVLDEAVAAHNDAVLAEQGPAPLEPPAPAAP